METTKTCCCCLLRPPDRDMKTPYNRLGITEIYSDMLAECFKMDLSLDYDNCDKEYGICSFCVGRLQDANDFKLQVQRSHMELRARLNSELSFKDEQPEVKVELSESDVPNDTLFVSENMITDSENEIKTPDIGNATIPTNNLLPENMNSDSENDMNTPDIGNATIPTNNLLPENMSCDSENDMKTPDIGNATIPTNNLLPENMSSDSENDVKTPDIVNATITTNNLLPEKSRAKYEKAYKDFVDWRMNKHTTSLSENVLLSYFEDLSKKFSASSLWTIYSMIKNTLNVKHQVDISKYLKLTTFLKRKAEGYTAKKAKAFSTEEVNKFLIEAPDQFYLQSKVALIFGIMGGCRRQELYNLQLNDVQCLDNTILVTVRNRKAKTARTFTVTGSYSDTCQKYMALRPKTCSTSNFFVNYSAGKCTNHKTGINKLGTLGKTIASYLNLRDSDMYTGHCFRRTSASLLVDTGSDITSVKRSSTENAEGYTDESMTNKVNVSNQMVNLIQNKEIVNINISSSSTSNQDPLATTQPDEKPVKLEVDFTSDYDSAKGIQEPSVSEHHVKKITTSKSLERLRDMKKEDKKPLIKTKNKRHNTVREHKEEKPYTCNTCELKFDKQRVFTRHMKICIPCCQICSENFKTQKKLSIHYRNAHMMGLYKCDVCEKVYQYKYALMYHLGTHMKPYCCEICKKKFARKSYLSDHMKTHSSDNLYPCDFCKKSFKTKKTLQVHIKCTHSEKTLECDVCFKLFSCHLSLNKHKYTHAEPTSMYCCEVCGRQFMVKHRLDSHMRTHTVDTPFICDYCDKKFKSKDGVRQHILVHLGLQPFSCQYCARKFTSSKSLNRHEQSHTGDKPYPCDICNKRFRHKYHLQKHTRLHTGEKPHTCETCGKQFADKSNLKTHLQIHVKDNTYYCDLCTKSYSTKESLRQHKRVHTTKVEKSYDAIEHGFYV